MPQDDQGEQDQVEDFAVPIGTGMRRVKPRQRTEFRPDEVERLRSKLDEFDAVRTRGDVESRSAHLGERSHH